MNRYQTEKAKIRDFAIDWQNDFPNHDYSYSELIAFTDMFTKLGKKYGLLTEFRENGIC